MTAQRIDLAIEGKATPDGRLLLPGALKWGDEPVPVTMRKPYQSEAEVIGAAKDFQRSDEGVISALVSVEGTWLDQCSVQIAVTKVHHTEAEGLYRIHSAALTNVHLMPGLTNAWPELDRRLVDSTHVSVKEREAAAWWRGHLDGCEDTGRLTPADHRDLHYPNNPFKEQQ